MTSEPSPPLLVLGAHHLAIKVRDLGAAERFYVGVLGLRVSRRWPAAGGAGDRSIWLELGPGGQTDHANPDDHAGSAPVPFLALETLADPGASAGAPLPAIPPVERPGHHLLAFRIPRQQRANWEAHLTQAGVAISHRSDYTLYFCDPEGNRLGLSHHPDPAPGG